MSFPVPSDEADRLAALQAEAILDTPDEPAFDRLARLAAAAAGPGAMGLISFVDRRRQWIKARCGLDLRETPRDEAFCAYTVMAKEVFWVADAAADARFQDFSFVKPQDGLRFYAGAPILGRDGRSLGAICVLERRPRAYDAALAAQLADLAAVASETLELRRSRRKLELAVAAEAQARALSESFLSHVPAALAVFDRQLRYVSVGPRWAVALDLGDGDLVGRSLYDTLPDARRFEALHRDALNGVTSSGRVAIEGGDGATRDVQYEMAPWRGPGGEVQGLIIASLDVSELMRARRRAERSETRLKLALEISETIVWEVVAKDRRVYASGPIANIFETPPDFEALSEDVGVGCHADDREAVRAAWRRHLKLREPFRIEHRVARQDGQEQWVATMAEAMLGPDGELQRVIGVMRDVTERKQFEFELARATEAASAASRAKSEFLANMSHELRTPLNGVTGITSALARTALDAEQRNMVGLIESSAKTLDELLAGVLDLARIESGQLSLQPQSTDVAALVAEVSTFFEWRAREKGVELACAVDPALHGMWLADPVRLRQVLTNLVSNAVKFTASGCVRVDARACDGDVEIEVSDTGIGFDDVQAAQLFRRFVQADGSITRRFGGSGLGLPIARSLAQLMGGGIDATGRPGEGATFRLRLPLARVAPHRGAPPEGEVRAPTPVLPRGLKLLLAEDHPVNRKVVELILGSAGAALTSVENGREAVEAFRSGPFDLVLMDMQMPVLDGLSAIREIRAQERRLGAASTPIVALTANALPEHVAASLAAGADAHLSKPLTAPALLGQVARLIERTPGDASRIAVG